MSPSTSDCDSPSSVDEDTTEFLQKHPMIEKNDNDAIQQVIAKRESKHVFQLRILVGCTLVMTALGVSLGVYYYTSHAEQNEFDEGFDASAEKILENIGSSLARTLGVMDAFAVNLVYMAEQNNETWPFVTIPNFPVRMAKMLSMSKGVTGLVFPKVVASERAAWETYSLANDQWVDECLAIQQKGLNDTFFGTISQKWDAIGYINTAYGSPSPERPVYFPNWQCYPVTNEVFPIYNYDLWSIPFVNVEKAVETLQASISQTYMIPNPADPVEDEFNSFSASWFAHFISPDQDPYQPMLDVYYVRYMPRIFKEVLA
jgi:hypothetical protein